MEPIALSVSQVQAYLACPLKYRFQYIDKLPRPWRVGAMAFGLSIHSAVEWYHRQKLAGITPDYSAVLQIFDADWYAQNLEPLVFSDRESNEGLREKGRALLELYLADRALGPLPTAVEQPFEVELHDPETGEAFAVLFRGIIDLIEQDGTLVDLKTAGRSLEQGGLERHLQLSAYALARLIETGEIPKLRLDMLYKTVRPRLEHLPTSRTLADLSWAAHLIRDVGQAIEYEHFFPNPSWRCNECEYFAHCQKWRGEVPSSHDQVVSMSSGGGVGSAA